ncbi:MAG: response regulator, partial [Bacteroidota bacterium]
MYDIILLEDLESDAELITRQIHKVNPEARVLWVKDGESFMNALRTYEPRLILADYHIPGYDGLKALEAANQLLPLVPFIFVTGTVNDEELAAETIMAGATAYFLKNKINELASKLKIYLQPQFP